MTLDLEAMSVEELDGFRCDLERDCLILAEDPADIQTAGAVEALLDLVEAEIAYRYARAGGYV